MKCHVSWWISLVCKFVSPPVADIASGIIPCPSTAHCDFCASAVFAPAPIGKIHFQASSRV